MSVTETFPNLASIEAKSQCAPGRIAIPEQIGSVLPISARAVAKDDTRDAFHSSTGVEISTPGENGMLMPLSPNTREDSRDITELSMNDRIRVLASQGLKPRDISSLLGVHPMIVIRLIADNSNNNKADNT